MNHLALFTGINGFGLAADIMGWEQIAHCEIDPFCQMIIKEYWPNSIAHYDIRETDFSVYRGAIDIISGGFPCQPYSTAGLRRGAEDPRHLWPQMFRAIRESKPGWVVAENVRGLANWNGGLVFEEVCSDLESEGYQVQPFILPAAGVGAPHKRDRVWFVAYNASNSRNNGHCSEPGCIGQEKGKIEGKKQREKRNEKIGERSWRELTGVDSPRDNTNAAGERLEIPRQNGFSKFEEENGIGVDDRFKYSGRAYTNPNGEGFKGSARSQLGSIHKQNGKPRFNDKNIPRDFWRDFPTQSPVLSGNDGFPLELLRQSLREDSMGYLAEKEINKILSKAFSAWRKETIKAAGNAVVTLVPLQIFKAIQQYENEANKRR